MSSVTDESLQAQAMLSKHPGMPMKALWEALNDSSIGAGVIMALILDPRCGNDRRSIAAECDIANPSDDDYCLTEGVTPFLLATYTKRVDVTKSILDAGLNASKEEAIGLAAFVGCLPAIELLLNKGVPVDVPDGQGRTPLQAAANSNRVDCVAFLIAKGADVNSPFCPFQTPLESAIHGGIESVELLVAKGADVNQSSHLGTPLRTAAMVGNVAIMEHLVAKGAAVNEEHCAESPLRAAATNGRLEAIEFLVSKGVDINAVDNGSGGTALYAATKPSVIDKLITLGADMNKGNAQGSTPLHQCALLKRVDCLKCLIAKGANVNAKNKHGQTPLHIVGPLGMMMGFGFGGPMVGEEQSTEECIMALIAGGADVNAVDGNGKTPLQVADEKGQEAIVKILMAKGAQ